MIKNIKRGLAVAAVAALPAAFAVTPAQAAGSPTASPAPKPTPIFVQDRDRGRRGRPGLQDQVLWTETYTDRLAVTSALAPRCCPLMPLGIDLDDRQSRRRWPGCPCQAPTGGFADPTRAASLIQSRSFDGVDDPFNFNNSNPLIGRRVARLSSVVLVWMLTATQRPLGDVPAAGCGE